MKRILFLTSFMIVAILAAAQTDPTIDPTGTFVDAEGTENSIHMGEGYSGSAPLKVSFAANPTDADGWDSFYEWRFYKEGEEATPYLTRYEQDTEYTFTTAGSHRIVCYATFTRGNEKIEYTDEFWAFDASPLSISISESKLEMPNAFSPNGDDINDIYKAKKGYQSLVEFKATIFNRWGVKLYEWDDPAGGWDGKYKGKDVAQGVYFVVVKARGADGRRYSIKRDVNLLRGYTETTSTDNQ